MFSINYKKLYVNQLSSNDCGCAALASVCKFYHFNVSLNQIKHIAKPRKGLGSSIWELGKVAEDLGFETQAVKLSPSSLDDAFTLPAILHLQLKNGATHFVTLYRITSKHIHVIDPATGHDVYTKEELWEISQGYCLLLQPTPKFELTKIHYKDQDKSIISSFFFDVIHKNTHIFVFSLLVSLLVVLMGIVFSYSFQAVIDYIVADSRMEMLSGLIVGFGIVAVLKCVFSMIQQQLRLKLDLRVNVPVIEKYYQHILKLPLSFFDNTEIGDIVIRCQDALTIKDFFIETITTIVLNAPMIVFSSIVLVFISTRMFIIILLSVMITATISLALRGAFQRLVNKEKAQSSAFQNQLIDSLRNIHTVKAFCKEDLYERKLLNSFSEYTQTSYKRGRLMNVQTTLQGLLVSAGNVALLGVSAYLIISSAITTGTMMTFFSVSSLFFESVLMIVSLIYSFESYRVSCKRVSELYSEEEENYHDHVAADLESKDSVSTFEGSIEADNISFGFGYQHKTIDSVSLSIKPGSKVAFVGESGSGKTTFAKLISGLYTPQKGNIIVSGNDISVINKHDLRKHFSIVAQKPEMFSDSVYNNLIFGANDEKSADRLTHVLEETDSQKLANSENACDLSQGEQQKLSIIRALINDGDIYILDEATSNLDCFGEKKIIDLFLNMNNKTVVFITHKLSLIQNCDQIFVFHDGKVVEKGIHEELMKLDGQYRKMWDVQNGCVK